MDKVDLWASIVGCWPPNGRCIVNWEAWAAVWTALGVLTALFAPVARRLAVRRRADAMFALAYVHHLQSASVAADRLAREYPLGSDTGLGKQLKATFPPDAETKQLLASCGQDIEALAKQVVNLAQWPPEVSIKLAHRIATSIVAAKRLVQGLEAIADTHRPLGPNAMEMFAGAFWEDLQNAVRELDDGSWAATDAATMQR